MAQDAPHEDASGGRESPKPKEPPRRNAMLKTAIIMTLYCILRKNAIYGRRVYAKWNS